MTEAQRITDAWSALLRTPVRVSTGLAPPGPGLIGFLHDDSGSPRARLELPHSAFYIMVDLLLGGTGRPPFIPNRPRTPLESRLADRIFSSAAHALGLTLAQLHDSCADGDDWSAEDLAIEIGTFQFSVRLSTPRKTPRAEAILAQTTLTREEVDQLAIGDVILTETPAEAPILFTTPEGPSCRARIAARRGKRAVVIAGA